MYRGLSRIIGGQRGARASALSTCTRWQSQSGTAAASQEKASPAPNLNSASARVSDIGAQTAGHANTQAGRGAMDRAADARRDIAELWRQCSEAETRSASLTKVNGEKPGETQDAADAMRLKGVEALLNAYNIDVTTPREEDVCRGLGEALDRLLLLCVPLPPAADGSTAMLERVLHTSARQGRKLNMRTVQHLFARTSHFAEALAVFYALRKCHFAMSIEAYHAMLYSLQRLEEEGWAERFHDEFTASKGQFVSEQALDFVLRGVDNQLLPESKPWLGRVMFADTDNAASQKQHLAAYDEMGKMWVNRYKGTEGV